jgi:hypothetical protein
MIKHILILSFLIAIIQLKAQSKKEQIQILSIRIDSLSGVLLNERNSYDNQIKEHSLSVFNLKSEIQSLKESKKSLETDKQSIESKLSKRIKVLEDSLQFLINKPQKVEDEFIISSSIIEGKSIWKLELKNPTLESIELIVSDENNKNIIKKVIEVVSYNRFGIYEKKDVEEFSSSNANHNEIEKKLNKFNKNRYNINGFSKVCYYSQGSNESAQSKPMKFEIINDTVYISIVAYYSIYDENIETWLIKNKKYDYENYFGDISAINFIRSITNNQKVRLSNVELWTTIFKVDVTNLKQAKTNPIE